MVAVKSLAAIAEWAADAPPAVLIALGATRREPSGPTAPAEATVRRVLQRVDGDALDAAIGTWLAARDPGRPPLGQERAAPRHRSLAVDGKTVRGARRADGTQVHLLAAMTGAGLVTAQREVDSKTNEITVFRPMLAPLDLADTVVTFDALHSQTAHARFLVEDKKAHYIAVIKGNQPLLNQHLKQLPWRDVPLLDKTRATAHGRDEIRRVKTAARHLWPRLPPRRPGRADRAPPPDRHHRQGQPGTRLRSHRPDGGAGRRRRDRAPRPRTLGHREQDPPCP
ncbi:ISAs1 family transposase [Streptomyces glomeratus]|uniref:ISAs1 family transposase n=1 Tax=Streptomyces glomeratus TaxID=284452 RepID=UPI001F371473|nr:ISAs1 family transposase [Streptomyces glomeratus]MCF1512582.1 ISAs1 family transposase [Streptomyces glomeratus]